MMRHLLQKGEKMNRFKNWLLLSLISLCSLSAHATDDPVIVTILEGKLGQIKKDSSRETKDLIYYSVYRNTIDSTNKTFYRNTIAFLINEDDTTYIAADFSATVWINIEWTDTLGVTRDTVRILSINYKVADSLKYDARNYIFFDNSRKVKITIDSVHTSTSSWDVTSVLRIENRMEIRRDYIFDCSHIVPNVEHEIGDVSAETGAFDELIVQWDLEEHEGITHYDVEWTWVDIDALDRYKIEDEFNSVLLFRNNSTRVTISASNNSYRVPLLYDGEGYVFYRVRPVQYLVDGNVVEGTWSTEQEEGVTWYHFENGHEPDLNWQATTSYAEDGKNLTSITYFDASLRSRQSVTKDNVTHTTIIAETFYDYQGRPVINVLPAPTLNTVIELAKNFNRFSNFEVHPKQLYDSVADGETICNASSPELNNEYGASRYYSPNNTDVNNGFHRFIPDASKYPYSEVRYTPDATGRIASQGGVGPQYQLGNPGGRRTDYFYGYADQKELDALFGTEVGHQSHYFKTMVRDPNGQYSVSYLDMSGRTIATALAGPYPDNLDSLESHKKRWWTKSLISRDNNVVKDRGIELATTLLVMNEGPHIFHYELSPQSAEIAACNPEGQPVCYDCYYDLEIRISGNCLANPIIITRKNFSFGEYDIECEEGPPSLEVDTTIILTEGEYNITKTLTLSKDAQDWYRNNLFSIKNICKTLEEFYDENYAVMIANSNCNMTCTSCEEALGTYSEFRAAFLTQLGIDTETPDEEIPFAAEMEASYNKALAGCQSLCAAPESKLNGIRLLMLEDMTPDQGQYAVLNNTRPYNIFNPNKPYNEFTFLGFTYNPYTLPLPSFAHPFDPSDNTIYYKDENSQPDASLSVNPPPADYSMEDFSAQFRPQWAQSLLFYHPEYSKLKWAQDHLTESYEWDAQLETIDTWAEAEAAGYLTGILDSDPFFDGAPGAEVYLTILFNEITFREAMQQMIEVNFKDNQTIWQLAMASIFCSNSNNPSCGAGFAATPPYSGDDVCIADWNNVWRIFRTIYLTEKDRLVNIYLDKHCPIGYSFLQQQGYQRRFGHYNDFYGNYIQQILNMIKNGNAQANADTYNQQQMQAEYAAACDSYIEMWTNRLLTCNTLNEHASKDEIVNLIITRMRKICVDGSDAEHPYGVASLPDRVSGTPRSFEEVIASVFTTYGISISELCHPYLIDYPQGYDKQNPVTNDVIFNTKDNCVCDRLKVLEQEKRSKGHTGTFSAYIQYQYGVVVRQTLLDSLQAGCTGVCNTYDSPVSIPAILTCNTRPQTCISCDEYRALKKQFKIEFEGFEIIYTDPATEEEVNRNVAFERFMNNRTGLNKTWAEYFNFEILCGGALSSKFTRHTLDSVVTAFYVEFPDPGYTVSCRDSFVVFFNTAFDTTLNFEEIEIVYQEVAGAFPDVCSPRLNCEVFDNIIAAFYEHYGTGIASDSSNCDTTLTCRDMFVNFFNVYSGVNLSYTWEDLEALSLQVCGRPLDVCEKFSCANLQQALDDWHANYPVIWLEEDCASQWVDSFNVRFNTDLNEEQIIDLYKNCGIYLNPCQPQIECNTLEQLLSHYYNLGDSACAESELDPEDEDYCTDCLAWFVNEKLGTDFTYEQIALMMRRVCGEEIRACNTRFTCDSLSFFASEFIRTNVEEECTEEFTELFNAEYNTEYSFDEIMNIYLLYCGKKPEICDKPFLLTCEQLNEVYTMFMKLYPDPSGYFGDSCKSAFVTYFNQYAGDTLNYEEIAQYYRNLCQQELVICTDGPCEDMEEFRDSYIDKYGGYLLPQSLCRDLFTRLFNKQFRKTPGSLSIPGLEAGLATHRLQPFRWSDIVNMYDSCELELDLCPVDTSGPDNCTRLEGAKQAFFGFYTEGLPVNCNKTFAEFFNLYYGTSFANYDSLQSWVSVSCDTTFYVCIDTVPAVLVNMRSIAVPANPLSPRLCGGGEPIFPPMVVEDPNPCDLVPQMALNAATEQYNVYVQQKLDNFDSTYRAVCLGAGPLEEFTVSSVVSEYHFTLYYYNRAGELVKTIPPAGVDLTNLDEEEIEEWHAYVEEGRALNESRVPAHNLATEYRYNTLGQVIMQSSPDGGMSKFWYDRLGRLVLSQNAKQAADDKYSYTKYDELGRITEVGQITNDAEVTQALTQDQEDLAGWFEDADDTREQITQTVYDLPADLCDPPSLLCQANLRNRVSYTTLTDLATDESYATATYFSYDIHGNVDTLLQHYNKGIMHHISGNAFKKMIWQYDLVSGNVNEVAYQPGVSDQFFHRYEYDARNRLTEVHTSHDYVYWEKQAAYRYYKHGLLARTEIGQLNVQGVDYAYTLQGWLKGVNGTIAVNLDMGFDGANVATPASDVYAFALHYNTTDFKTINSSIKPFLGVADGLSAHTDGVITGKNLFNGNIASMVVSIRKFEDAIANLYGYRYDQLNRIVAMNHYNCQLNIAIETGEKSLVPNTSEEYKERISYDPNGNILTYLRNANTNGTRTLAQMDDLTYSYYSATNQLLHVADAVNSSYTTDIEDIEDQGEEEINYVYDAIGNLVIDKAEGLYNEGDPTKEMIEWTVYGKISKITKIKGEDVTVIHYTYDPAGNRISKTIIVNETDTTYTWYVRDASGNVMSVYQRGNSDINNGDLSQTELHLYGSGRLGLWKSNRNVQVEDWGLFDITPMGGTNGGQTGVWARGQTIYELSNHLGNVLVTISDKRKGIDLGSNGGIDYYEAIVLTANDYYPFGMLMPERKYSLDGKYRYGFNGKENDNEVKGEGNQQDYGMRIYDPRLGRWFSPDKVVKSHLSSYQTSSNNPVNLLDPDGNDEIHFHYYTISKEVMIRKWDNSRGGFVAVATTVHQTYRWVEIVKNENSDNFFVHRAGFGMESTTTQFYPNYNEPVTTGITESSYLFGAIKTKDTDYESLQKLVKQFPGLRDQVLPETARDPAAKQTFRDLNYAWWQKFYGKIDKEEKEATEKAQVDNLMLGIIVGAAVEAFVVRIGTAIATAVRGEVRVLGSHEQYLQLAKKLGAKAFNVPTKIMNEMSEADRWAANVKFLDRGIANGDTFILSNSGFTVKEGSSFYKELQYMYSRGYKLSEDGMSLIKK